MTVPFSKYILVKDHYCLSYFGEDKEVLSYLLNARDCIEKELPGIKVFICCSENMTRQFHGKRNLINESKLKEYQGRFTYYRNLVKKDDINLILEESKIPH